MHDGELGKAELRSALRQAGVCDDRSRALVVASRAGWVLGVPRIASTHSRAASRCDFIVVWSSLAARTQCKERSLTNACRDEVGKLRCVIDPAVPILRSAPRSKECPLIVGGLLSRALHFHSEESTVFQLSDDV
jgi:hypothetical protein